MSSRVTIRTKIGRDPIIIDICECVVPVGIMIGQSKEDDTERVYIPLADWPTVREAAQRVYDAAIKEEAKK